jgi:hypothetical protein
LASSIRRAFQIAGSLKLPVFSAITSRMPETYSRMGLDEPIVGRDMAIAATCHWSTDLTALIAGFLVRYRAHKLHDLIHIVIELPSQ